MLQFGTYLLMMIALIVPISEWFDRWDAPGLSNDVEFAVFSLILGLCLVLLVSRLIAAMELLIEQFSVWHVQTRQLSFADDAFSTFAVILPPRNAPPLRI